MTRQAMNYPLGRLEQLGYVERRVDPDDVRSCRVHLTPRGMSTISIIRDAVTELERHWEAQLGPERRRQLNELLAGLDETAADEPAADRRAGPGPHPRAAPGQPD